MEAASVIKSPIRPTDVVIDDTHAVDSNHISNELKLADMMIDSIETIKDPKDLSNKEISNGDVNKDLKKKTKVKLLNSFNNFPPKGENNLKITSEGLMKMNKYTASPELSKALLKASSSTTTTAPNIGNLSSVKSYASVDKPQLAATKTRPLTPKPSATISATINTNSKNNKLAKSKLPKDSSSKLDNHTLGPQVVKVKPGTLNKKQVKSGSLHKNQVKSAWKETNINNPTESSETHHSTVKDTNLLEFTNDDNDVDLCISDDDDDFLNEDDHNSLRNSIQSFHLSTNGISGIESSILVGAMLPKSTPFQFSIEDDLKGTSDCTNGNKDNKIEALCHQYSITPSVCQSQRKLLNCDGKVINIESVFLFLYLTLISLLTGDMINIKSLDGDGDVVLHCDAVARHCDQYKESSILQASISPSGIIHLSIYLIL
jgi:hypothetical protein